jgi:magnesium chelatase family protein
LAEFEFVGELALSGELRSVRGVLPIVLSAAAAGRSLIVPSCNAKEAALVKQATAYSASHLLEVCAYLKGKTVLPRCELSTDVCAAQTSLDLSDVRGQAFAKRALEVAASGKHSLLLIGPPGTGKTMLAARLPSIMPPLSDQQALEVATVASVSHAGFDQTKWGLLPLRAPHHTASSVALVGGGRPPRPGEISLAHQGVYWSLCANP